MVVAEGLTPYLPPRRGHTCSGSSRICQRRLVFDAYSRFGLKLLRLNPSIRATGPSPLGIDDPHELDSRSKLRFVEDISATSRTRPHGLVRWTVHPALEATSRCANRQAFALSVYIARPRVASARKRWQSLADRVQEGPIGTFWPWLPPSGDADLGVAGDRKRAQNGLKRCASDFLMARSCGCRGWCARPTLLASTAAGSWREKRCRRRSRRGRRNRTPARRRATGKRAGHQPAEQQRPISTAAGLPSDRGVSCAWKNGSSA